MLELISIPNFMNFIAKFFEFIIFGNAVIFFFALLRRNTYRTLHKHGRPSVNFSFAITILAFILVSLIFSVFQFTDAIKYTMQVSPIFGAITISVFFAISYLLYRKSEVGK